MTFWTVERVRPPPKNEPDIPEKLQRPATVTPPDDYVTYPMREIVNEAYHSDENADDQKVTSVDDVKLNGEPNRIQEKTAETNHIESERPLLRRTKSNRDAVFDKVVRQSQTEENVTDYRLTSGSEGNENADDNDGVTVELRNKRIRVKSKDCVSYLKNELFSKFSILQYFSTFKRFSQILPMFLCKYIHKMMTNPQLPQPPIFQKINLQFEY